MFAAPIELIHDDYTTTEILDMDFDHREQIKDVQMEVGGDGYFVYPPQLQQAQQLHRTESALSILYPVANQQGPQQHQAIVRTASSATILYNMHLNAGAGQHNEEPAAIGPVAMDQHLNHIDVIDLDDAIYNHFEDQQAQQQADIRAQQLQAHLHAQQQAHLHAQQQAQLQAQLFAQLPLQPQLHGQHNLPVWMRERNLQREGIDRRLIQQQPRLRVQANIGY